jgi:hypothetical protein
LRDILDRHGTNGPATFHRNTTKEPIDGIWITLGLHISEGGYFGFDKVFPNTDHRCLWIDISFSQAFRHNMPSLIWPMARRLTTRDPRIVHNFVNQYKSLIVRHDLHTRANVLEANLKYPLPGVLQREYEAIDKLRMAAVAHAEHKCRKLWMGQVAFSPIISTARLHIKVCHCLRRRQKA